MAQSDTAADQFHWEPQPRAQAFIDECIAKFLARCERSRTLADRMLRETSTRFQDWVDFLRIPETDEAIERLLATGFAHRPAPGASQRYVHDGGVFPQVLLGDGPLRQAGVKVDWVADFLAAWNVPNDSPISGEPLTPLRRAVAFRGDNTELVAVERHGYAGFAEPQADHRRSVAALRHMEALRRRRRDWPTDDQGFEHVHALVDSALEDLSGAGHIGTHFVCDLFFRAERDFWERRNSAARWQKARQDLLGLGWANHDHHTFRCSREYFVSLIRLLEKLGFRCRERFYAGNEAGWGAQVLEQPVTGVVVFADVDLSPEELAGDFAHTPLEPRNELGTIGLWTGLHGESILQAGMHHLECQFDHDHLTKSLEGAGHKVMAPFTNFDFLRQAFTKGEHWRVAEKRLRRLLDQGRITEQQAQQFRDAGAVGSHLENLERNDGYKGFNQQGVSDIIKRTDARLVTYEAIA
jgi:hypothetical protein